MATAGVLLPIGTNQHDRHWWARRQPWTGFDGGILGERGCRQSYRRQRTDFSRPWPASLPSAAFRHVPPTIHRPVIRPRVIRMPISPVARRARAGGDGTRSRRCASGHEADTERIAERILGRGVRRWPAQSPALACMIPLSATMVVSLPSWPRRQRGRGPGRRSSPDMPGGRAGSRQSAARAGVNRPWFRW